jgi:hypothetical protein
MLRDCANGGYRYLPGVSAFSSGVVARPGFEIVHVVLGASAVNSSSDGRPSC